MRNGRDSHRLAVLIDADNTSARYATAIFDEIASLGEANDRRIYGDFSGARLGTWDLAVQSLAILQRSSPSPAGKAGGVFRCWRGGGFVDLRLILLVEVLSEHCDLAALEVGELDGAPAVGGAGHGAEHELEHRALAEGVRDDLQAPALLDEQALEKVRNRYELGGADARPWRTGPGVWCDHPGQRHREHDGAGRPACTMSFELVLVAGRLCDSPGCAVSADS
jgi:hypothetical protein